MHDQRPAPVLGEARGHVLHHGTVYVQLAFVHHGAEQNRHRDGDAHGEPERHPRVGLRAERDRLAARHVVARNDQRLARTRVELGQRHRVVVALLAQHHVEQAEDLRGLHRAHRVKEPQHAVTVNVGRQVFEVESFQHLVHRERRVPRQKERGDDGAHRRAHPARDVVQAARFAQAVERAQHREATGAAAGEDELARQ